MVNGTGNQSYVASVHSGNMPQYYGDDHNTNWEINTSYTFRMPERHKIDYQIYVNMPSR